MEEPIVGQDDSIMGYAADTEGKSLDGYKATLFLSDFSLMILGQPTFVPTLP